jgi:hypothetical protein
MDAETFNAALRKFLREVGVTSQQAVEAAVANGNVTGPTLRLKMTLTSPDVPLEHVVEHDIDLG